MVCMMSQLKIVFSIMEREVEINKDTNSTRGGKRFIITLRNYHQRSSSHSQGPVNFKHHQILKMNTISTSLQQNHTKGFPEGSFTLSTSGSHSTLLSGRTRTPGKSLKFAPYNHRRSRTQHFKQLITQYHKWHDRNNLITFRFGI